MNNNENNQNSNNEDFNFRKEFENQRKELANMQRMTQSYHTVTLPENAGESYKRKNFTFKFRYLFIVILLAVVGIYFYNYYTVNKEHLYGGSANIESLYDKNNLIKIIDNKLYGYIDYSGKEVIPAKYTSATDFYNGYALVSDGQKSSIINVEGKYLFDVKDEENSSYNIDYDYWIIDNTLYSGQMLKYQNDVKLLPNTEKYFYYHGSDIDRTFIINHLGKSVYELVGKNYTFDVKSGSHTKDLIFISGNNKYLIINPDNGKVIYESNEKITLLDDGVYKKDRLYFIYDDETFYPFDASNVSLVDREKKIIKVENGEKITYYDVVNNSELESYKEDNNIVASQFNYDVITCGKEENIKYGLNKSGQVMLECKYDSIEFLNEGLHEYIRNKNGQEYVFAQNVELSSIYNLRFKYNILEEDYVYKSYLNGSAFVAYSPNEDNEETHIIVFNLISSQKKKYAKNDYRFHTSGNNYYVLYNKRDNKLEYYNYDMKHIYSIKYDDRMQ